MGNISFLYTVGTPAVQPNQNYMFGFPLAAGMAIGTIVNKQIIKQANLNTCVFMILFYNKIIYLIFSTLQGFQKVVVCIVQRYVDFTIMRNTA